MHCTALQLANHFTALCIEEPSTKFVLEVTVNSSLKRSALICPAVPFTVDYFAINFTSLHSVIFACKKCDRGSAVFPWRKWQSNVPVRAML